MYHTEEFKLNISGQREQLKDLSREMSDTDKF